MVVRNANEDDIAEMLSYVNGEIEDLNVEEGEFVLQIPYYPPIESVKSDFTLEKCMRKVR